SPLPLRLVLAERLCQVESRGRAIELGFHLDDREFRVNDDRTGRPGDLLALELAGERNILVVQLHLPAERFDGNIAMERYVCGDRARHLPLKLLRLEIDVAADIDWVVACHLQHGVGVARNVDLELANDRAYMRVADRQRAVLPRNGAAGRHVGRAALEGDVDISAVELYRADGVANGRYMTGNVEASVADPELAKNFAGAERNAIAEAAGRHIPLDLSVLHAPAEDVCEYPTPRGIGGEPRPELLGVSDGHILNADAELDARALSFLKLQDRTAGNDALVGAPRYLADVDCAEACIGV